MEGAFPNAVTDRLIHNLRRRRILMVYVAFVKQLLTRRHTRLKFDNFVSESINILCYVRVPLERASAISNTRVPLERVSVIGNTVQPNL